MNVETSPASHATAADEAHIKALVKFTALSFKGGKIASWREYYDPAASGEENP